jgi:hypothetical protein
LTAELDVALRAEERSVQVAQAEGRAVERRNVDPQHILGLRVVAATKSAAIAA